MLPMPSAPCRVAILGFGAFERQALESWFRLAASHVPRFETADSAADSDCCVVDADRPAAVQAAQSAGKTATSVFVGAEVPAEALLRLPRPIEPVQVARALTALWQMQGGEAATATPAVPRAQAASPLGALPRFDIDVLVVDDCSIARRHLQVLLERHGCRVTLAASGEEALARLDTGRQAPRIVFTDIVMPGLDGLALCQRIKGAGRDAPAVALVSARATQADRVRGSLAGCEAVLDQPLTGAALLGVLRGHATAVR